MADAHGHDASNETMYTFDAKNNTLASGATTSIKVDGRVTKLVVAAVGTTGDVAGICIDRAPASNSDYFQFIVNVSPFILEMPIKQYIHLKNVSANSMDISILIVRK